MIKSPIVIAMIIILFHNSSFADGLNQYLDIFNKIQKNTDRSFSGKPNSTADEPPKNSPSTERIDALPTQTKLSAAQVIPPARAKITYKGTYTGELITQSGKKSSSEELAGAITVEVTYDGSAVTLGYVTTGLIVPGKMSGVIIDGVCKLYEKDRSVFDGICSAGEFNGTLRSPSRSRKAINMNIAAKMTKLVDYDELEKIESENSKKREIAATEAQRRSKIKEDAELKQQDELLKSLPSIKK